MKRRFYAIKNALEYLELSALKFKDKIAAEDKDTTISYAALIKQSKQIGSYLLDNMQSSGPIPVFMEKGIDTLTAFFGIIYSGNYYVLINPSLPKSRILQILDVLGADFVVTTHCYDEALSDIFTIKHVFYLEDATTTISTTALENVRNCSLDNDPLYINFTSGSTGTPKGVVICHRSVIDFIDEFTELFDINASDVIANQAPFDFDVSVKDIYSSIKTGAKLVIVPKELFSAPTKLADFLCEKEITTMIWAVSALCLITTFHILDYKFPTTVNKILFSGEVMPLKHLKQWVAHFPNALFVNLYGPTEITCNCTYFKVDNNMTFEKTLPIGKPFNNEKVFLLSEQNSKISGYNINGEICISGTALALGYYNNDTETEKHFTQNPLNTKYLEVIYRSGDLGYYDEDENLCFAGRKDFQIKHQGHRIELEEIEMAISSLDGIHRACCVFQQEKGKLVAYYVGTLEAGEVKTKLSKTLPIYMLPSSLRKIESIPITANGKMNRKELLSFLDGKSI